MYYENTHILLCYLLSTMNLIAFQIYCLYSLLPLAKQKSKMLVATE